MNADNVDDVPEVHATSFFRVKRCTVSNFLCIIGLRVIQKAYESFSGFLKKETKVMEKEFPVTERERSL